MKSGNCISFSLLPTLLEGGAETSYAREPLENKCTKKSPVGADMGPPPLYLDPIERYFLTLISGAVDSPRNVPSAFA